MNKYFHWLTSFTLLWIVWEITRYIIFEITTIPHNFFPSGRGIFLQLIYIFQDGNALKYLLETTKTVSMALVIAITITIPTALFFNMNKMCYKTIKPFFDFLRSTPPSTPFPLFLILFGLQWNSKFIITLYFTTLLLATHAIESTSDLHNKIISTWEINGVSKSHIAIYLLLPHIAISSITGLKIVGSITIALAVITEMYIGSTYGLGGAIIQFKDLYDFKTTYAYIFLTGTFGFAINIIFDLIDRKVKYGVIE